MKTPVLDIVRQKMKKQGIKSFFKTVSTNSNVAKETKPVETTTSAEVPSKSSKVRKLKSLMKNQINLIAHLYFQKCFCQTKPIVSSTVVCRK